MLKHSEMKEQKSLFRPNVSIRNFLIIPFAVLMASMIVALTLLSFQKGNDAVEQIKIKIRERTLVGVRAEIRKYMNTAHRLNLATENFIAKGHLDINDPIALQAFFWNQLRVYDNVNYIYFGYRNGGIILIAKRSDGRFVVRQTELSKDNFPAGKSKVYSLDEDGRRDQLLRERKFFDSRTRPWFKKAVAKKGPIWTEVYPFFLEETLGITASRPLYDRNDQLLGVISTDILLTTFNDVLNSLKPTDKSQLFIIEKSGALIASTEDKKPFLKTENKLNRIHASQSRSQVIRAVYNRFSQGNDNSFDVMVNGRPHLVEIFPIQDELGINWLIGLAVAEEEILGPGREALRLIVYFGVGALLLSAILSIFLGRSLSMPLLNLQGVAQSLARGKNAARAEQSSIVEINSLAESFNSMAGTIQQSVKELEQKNADLNAEIRQRKETERQLRYFKEEIDIKQRTKLASELHDGIGQSLQAINLGLKMLAKENGVHEATKERFDDLIGEVGASIQQLRDIIERQRPIFLDQMDILTAIEHFGKKLAQRGGFNFNLNSEIERLDLEPIYKEPIFLIFQEALSNAAKYANASQIVVDVELSGDGVLHMRISDDGVGFEFSGVKPKSSGLGLSIMSERAQSIGGMLEIASTPSGTCISMEIPLNG